jgi:ESS family glutamate:Na+ symporter
MAPLAMQLALILTSIWLGKLIISWLVKVPYAPAANLFSKFPSLLYGIIGALIIWPVMRKLKIDSLADKNSINNISGVALEICIASATATLNLKMFAAYIVPIMLHMVVIIALMTFICLVLVPRWIKKDWFELALMAYGQGHGSTPSGLALARCVDPQSRTEAWEAFGVALGVVTPFTSMLAALLPLLALQSVWIIVGIGGAVSIACILVGELILRRA